MLNTNEKRHQEETEESTCKITTCIPGVFAITSCVFDDYCGYFMEVCSEKAMEAPELIDRFMQDNQSYTKMYGSQHSFSDETHGTKQYCAGLCNGFGRTAHTAKSLTISFASTIRKSRGEGHSTSHFLRKGFKCPSAQRQRL